MSEESIPRLAALGSAILVLCAVTATPLAMLDHEFLTAHMVQHLLLMTVAAPLILWGSQLGKLQLGVAPHPVFCWLAGTGTVIGWHIPAAFALGMRSNFWHDAELVSFLAAGLLFWWPVIQPWPSAIWPLWSVPLYLFLATLPCDALSAFLTFCGRLVYPHYAGAASALADQERAGALMWVWVTFVYLAPAVAVALRCLEPRALREPGRDRRVAGSTTSAGTAP